MVDFSVKSNSLSYKLYSLLQTVTTMKNYFTIEEINLAEKVKSLYKRLDASPLRKFSRWLNKGSLTHINVTLKDARRSELINGKEVVKLTGKATRLSQVSREAPVVIEIPRELINTRKNMRLFVDVIYMNKIPFLHTISKNADFRTLSYLKVETKMSLFKALEKVIKKYNDSGLIVKFINTDMQFEYLEDDFGNINFEIVDTDNYAHSMEHSIRMIK